MSKKQTQFIALLRGINVGGHHKVPMAELRELLARHGYSNIITILNSGNVIFEVEDHFPEDDEVSILLEDHFGFPIPTHIRTATDINKLVALNPFQNILESKSTRFYITFLHQDVKSPVGLPWESDDKSYRILRVIDQMVVSVLDVSVTRTPKAMDSLEKFFGKNLTTRNWNTIMRIYKKLNG